MQNVNLHLPFRFAAEEVNSFSLFLLPKNSPSQFSGHPQQTTEKIVDQTIKANISMFIIFFQTRFKSDVNTRPEKIILKTPRSNQVYFITSHASNLIFT